MSWPAAFLLALIIVCATILILTGHAHVLAVAAALVFFGFMLFLLA